MTTINLEGSTGGLRIVVGVNGSAHSTVAVFSVDNSDTPLFTDEVKLVRADAQAKLLARMPESERVSVEPVLRQLAAAVMAARERVPASTPDQQGEDEPWPESVPGAELLDSLMLLLARYVLLPVPAATAVALWIVHTYLVDVSDYTPYLLLTSPVRGCGKSTLLDLLFHLVCRPKLSSGITAAALYRTIDRDQPSFLVDEIDTRLHGDGGEMLRGVLDAGFHRAGAITICVGDKCEPTDFRVFCPKALAGIGKVWDTVASRSIPIRLERATRTQLSALTKIRGDRIGATCRVYRRQLQRYATDVREELRAADPEVPDSLGGREADVWRPLLAIADSANDVWGKRACEAARALHESAGEEGDYGLLMLADVRALFDRLPNDGKLASAAIVTELVKMEERPWPEYRNERPITTRGLASLLGRFGVKPKNVRAEGASVKGYELDDLLPAFTRYLVVPKPTPPPLKASEVTDARTPVAQSESEPPRDPLHRSSEEKMHAVADVADRKETVDEQYEIDERAGIQEVENA